MSLRPWSPETLYGPAGTGGPVPAGARREPLYRAPLVEWARPAPSDREPLYAGRLLDLAADHAAHSETLDGPGRPELAEDRPAHREPLYQDAAELLAHVAGPHALHHANGTGPRTVAELIRADLAQAYRAAWDREPLYGPGTGAPAGILAAAAAPLPPDVAGLPAAAQREQAARLVDDARAALGRRPAQAAQEPRPVFEVRPELAGTLAGRLDHGRAALVRELAADVLAQAGRLEPDAYAAQLDTRDRMAAAILADHGPVALTGRPVHALQLADGRAFLLADVDGRPQWQPTGPRPLIGCPTLAGPWQDQDAPQDVDDGPPDDGPELAGRYRPRIAADGLSIEWTTGPTDRRRNPAPASKDRRRNGPDTDGSQAPDVARAWDGIRRAQRERTRPAQATPYQYEPCPLDPTAGPCRCGPRSVRCLPPRDQEQARDVDDAPQELPEHPRAWIARALDAAPGFEVAGRPVRAFELADGTAYRLTPDGWQLQDQEPPRDVDDAPRELAGTLCGITGRPCLDPCPAALGTGALCGRHSTPQELAGPSTPGPGPEAHSGRPGRPSVAADGCERGAPCPFPVRCVGPCHLATLRTPPQLQDDAQADALRLVDEDRPELAAATYRATGLHPLDVDAMRALVDASDASAALTAAAPDVADAREHADPLADVDDLADLAHAAAQGQDGPDVDELAGRVRDAGTWTHNTYARRCEPALLLHREPLHAFTDAVPLSGPSWSCSAGRHADCRHVACPCPCPCECHTKTAQQAHDRVTAAAHACTCLTRQPNDPPCPIAGPHPPAQEA